MAVSLATLLTTTQSLLADPNKGTYTDAVLTPLLNRQHSKLAREIAQRLPEMFEAVQTIAFVEGTQEYALNPVPYRIRRVEIYTEGATWPTYVLKNFLDSSNKWIMSGYGTPCSVYLSGNNIGFVPAPSSGSAKVVGIQLPADMTSGGTPVPMGLPDICQDLLAIRTAVVAKAVIMNEEAGGLIGLLKQEEADLYAEMNLRTESEYVPQGALSEGNLYMEEA